MRKLVVLILALTMVAAGACGDDDDGDVAVDETTTTTEAVTEFVEPPFEGDEAEVASAYERFFSSDTPPEEAAALMEATELTEAILTAAAAGTEGSSTSVEVTGVRVDGDIAEVRFTLKTDIVGDVPGPRGIAVRQDGEWKVGIRTLCDLLGFLPPEPEDCAAAREAGAQLP